MMTYNQDPNKVNTNKTTLLELANSLSKQSKLQFHDEQNIIILGDEKSGKSLLFNSIFNIKKEKDIDSYSQTCGITYSSLTKTVSLYKKQVLNGYEIGGGIENINLIDCILNKGLLENMVIIVVFDLDRPYRFLRIYNEVISQLGIIFNRQYSKEELLDKVNRKRKEISNKEDESMYGIFPCEMIFLGMKYDKFEKMDM